MKRFISNLSISRDSPINLAAVISILLVTVLGCSNSGDSSQSGENAKKPVPSAYVGVWTGQDGSTVTIRNDGSGDYKSGGTSVNGASVKIDETAKEIRFSFMGFDSGKYKIDQAPKDNRMRLDGMEYRRSGGFSADASNEESDSAKSGKVPSDAELNSLVGETLRDLDNAVQQGDFSEFYTTVAEMFQKKFTAADLNKEFADTIRRKDKFKLKTGASLTFTSKPVLKNEGNTFDVEGTYPTTIGGRSVPFQLTYVKENDRWKLLGVYLNPNSPPATEK